MVQAAREGKDGCLKTLLDAGAAKDVQNTYGNTALMLVHFQKTSQTEVGNEKSGCRRLLLLFFKGIHPI